MSIREEIIRIITSSGAAGVTDTDIQGTTWTDQGRRRCSHPAIMVVSCHPIVPPSRIRSRTRASHSPAKLPDSNLTERMTAYNDLIQSSRIQLLGDLGNPRYAKIAQEEAVKFKGLSPEDVLVYQTIENRERMGVWTREIKSQTGLPQAKISKCIRTLEDRGLIKAIKSVQNASRKVYILSTLEPAKEITGGPWYGPDQQIDQEFVSALQKVVKMVVHKSPMPVSAETVCKDVSAFAAFNAKLELEDVQKVLKVLCYEVELERITIRDPATGMPVDRFRKSRWPKVGGPALTSIPCGVCPVFNECSSEPGALISPSNCEYMREWFSKDNPMLDGLLEPDDGPADAKGEAPPLVN